MLATLAAALLAAQSPSSHRPIPLAPLTPPPARFQEQSEDLDFSYGWDRDVEELAPLRAHLEAEREAMLRAARRDAERSAARSRAGDGPFRYFRSWAAQGRAGPLRAFRSLTGRGRGEFPPIRFDGLIWSTATNRALTFADVLGTDWPDRFRTRFCAGLMEEHARGLGASVPRECPDLSATAPMPMDYDDDGRFDTVDVLFEGWFPGDLYRIGIPLTAADVAASGIDHRAYLEPWEPRRHLPAR